MLLMHCGSQGVMTCIYQAYLSNDHLEVKGLLSTASNIFADNVLFPNTLTEIAVLEAFPDNDFTQYLLGCFFYAKRDYSRAVRHWEKVLCLNPNYAPVLRNLSVHAYNKCQDTNQAIELMSRAFALAPDDARILYELDYLQKAAGISPAERLRILTSHSDIVAKRDDLTAELLNICNITGDLDRAADCLATRQFHPWEGGEGRITGQFVVNKLRLALRLIREQRFQEAIDYLEAALHYPHNLGEGRLVGQTDNDLHYYLGFCHQKLDLHEQATEHFNCAIQGKQDLGQSRYYNDQPADYLFYQAAALHQLGRTDQAIAIYENMIVWAEAECHTPVEVDFFAVSLPALIVFDTDMQSEHMQHCLFVKAMGQLGLALVTQSVLPNSDSKKDFEHILQTLLMQSPAHTKANLFKEVAKHSYAFDRYGQA